VNIAKGWKKQEASTKWE